MDKSYFNHLEEKLGIHFGVSDRLILRDFVKRDGNFGLIGEMERSIYSNLKSLGYESVELDNRLEKDKRYFKNSLKEWRRKGF